ncbi:alanine racemase [uncultured Tyzzerella sp.]|uniref:alanine racemase n=1 Tax=uncultured Tyzzerella sp. TaxID=2321398 RepID=UPI002943751E|nr:alanine racemase [uncultured Tyzzerella sp.]
MIEYERVIAEINLDNIAYNMANIRKSVDEKTKIMAIVKADAYGHGSVEVAKTALYNGADWLGVAIIDEAIELRKNNIFEPILILGNTIEYKLLQVIKYNITQTIFSYDIAKKLSDEALKIKKSVDIHIKIDTGMSRLGFLPTEESIEEIMAIKKLPYINITGIFTHFATSDMEDKNFTKEQFEKYMWIIDKLEKRGINNLIKHVSNSGAILDLQEYRLDMVRAGIILYGMYPSTQVLKNIDIKPAMSLKTYVTYVKEIEPNVSVSYCRTYFTNKKTKIATIPVGYADGYARILSNKARVFVNGYYANVVGNICMDQFMIDVTNIPNIKQGDIVTLMGQDITAEELARLQNTINYEIVCNIGKRVPRVYIKNNEFLKIKK